MSRRNVARRRRHLGMPKRSVFKEIDLMRAAPAAAWYARRAILPRIQKTEWWVSSWPSSRQPLGDGVAWDTVPGLSISLNVSFAQACTFEMTLFGKAVV